MWKRMTDKFGNTVELSESDSNGFVVKTITFGKTEHSFFRKGEISCAENAYSFRVNKLREMHNYGIFD